MNVTMSLLFSLNLSKISLTLEESTLSESGPCAADSTEPRCHDLELDLEAKTSFRDGGRGGETRRFQAPQTALREESAWPNRDGTLDSKRFLSCTMWCKVHRTPVGCNGRCRCLALVPNACRLADATPLAIATGWRCCLR